MNEIRNNFIKVTKEYLLKSYNNETYTSDQKKSFSIEEKDNKRKIIYEDLC